MNNSVVSDAGMRIDERAEGVGDRGCERRRGIPTWCLFLGVKVWSCLIDVI